MAKINRFEDIMAWQKARDLTMGVYRVCRIDNYKRDYNLIDQTKRSAVSIMANIAEGFGRRSKKEFANFLNMAHGSAAELQCHLYVAMDQGFLGKSQFQRLYEQANEISKMIQGLMNYLKSSELRKQQVPESTQ